MEHLKILNRYFYKYRIRLIAGVIFITCANVFAVYSPQVIRHAIDSIAFQISYFHLLDGTINSARFITLISISVMIFGGIVILLAVLKGLFMFFMRQTIIVMSRWIEFDQKNEIYRHYQTLHLNFYKENSTGDLMSRITEDVSRVRMYTGPAVMYTINLFVLVILVVYTMMRVNPELTLYTVAPLPLLGLTIFYVNSIIERKSERIQQQLSQLTSAAQESYSGIRLIKSFVQERFMNQFFAGETEKYKSKTLDLAKTEAIYFPVIMLLVCISTLSAIFIGGNQVIAGKISAGNIAEFVIYINMLTWPIASVGWVMALVQRAAASQKRLNEFLSIRPEIVSHGTQEVSIRGNIEFRNVSFTYSNTGVEALKNISFSLSKGMKLAVIGRTGSGKSSLAQLFVRLYDPQEGDVLIDGVNIRSMKLTSLRRQIGYVPQDVFLFSDTVYKNIEFGLEENRISEKEIVQAAIAASVHEDVGQLHHQYETMIGERGVTLSGGQKQRLSIARALIKNPQIVIFDDCLSAVDAQTESNIITYLGEILKEKTAIIITHRIFSLLSFDKIIVLEEGRIVESGTHDLLMEQKGIYFELYQKQQRVELEGEFSSF